jgi:hypothetical protein
MSEMIWLGMSRGIFGKIYLKVFGGVGGVVYFWGGLIKINSGRLKFQPSSD